MIVTTNLLHDMGACARGVYLFEQTFGDNETPLCVNSLQRAYSAGLDVIWFLEEMIMRGGEKDLLGLTCELIQPTVRRTEIVDGIRHGVEILEGVREVHFFMGRKHRADGPAIIWSDERRSQEYWIGGHNTTKRGFEIKIERILLRAKSVDVEKEFNKWELDIYRKLT